MYVKLGLTGTKFGLIIVTLTFTIPFVTWMLIGYFKNIPPIEKLGRIDGLGRFETFLKIFIPVRKLGSASPDMAYVAAGRYDGYWQRDLQYWDIAAGIIIVREAGGYVTDFSGGNDFIKNKTIIASNSKINKEMVEVLNS